MEEARGRIVEIQRMSTEDGPGLRTTVFFKGCPLRCSWCHNPETLSPELEVQWTAARCIGCGACRRTCQAGAIRQDQAGIRIDRSACRRCGGCAAECPSTAMETLGHDWSAPALAAELMKDAAYFRSSGGGVTLSGGEATMQPEFALELLKGLAHRGVHTALDTCGVAAWPVMERLLPHVDLLLFDVKEMDPSRHRRFTGAGNHRVLETLRRVTGAMERGGGPRELWVRTPIIPGVTDRTENIRRIGAFLRQYVGAKLSRWDLCAFNNLCLDKYLRLGRDWAFAGSPLVGRRQMEALAEIARLSGLEESVVHWSGSVTEDGR